ncbi:maestro heat-like repeat family member 5 isoform X1 [Haliaeetus albicilla]|uniref:maestro heat-like repeat family member 5 isoform X1 n=2 Tax=Haliaeetus albicilla TaxID=8969 RepID=UPI0037E99B11
MWDVMLSQTHTLEKVLRELLSKLQDQQLRRVFGSSTEDACIHHLALLASSDMKSEEFAGLYNVHRYLRRPSLALLSLALRGLVTLSQRPETARKILVLLPDIMETQQNASSDNKMKALLVFRNVMGHMKRKEASPTALQLVDKLPPLFDDQSSQLRELSICLFKDAMQTVVGNDKQQMRKNVRRSLLPLFFHMSDQTESVAKASQEALLVAAKLLKWKRLKHLTRTQQTGRIGECLLVQDRSRVEEYLSQSLPYLKDAQVTLREAALKFIGLAARHLGDESEEKLSEICNGEQGQCCVRQDWWGRGQSLGSVLLCLALLQGDASRAEERLRGIWGIPEQQLPADAFVPPAPSGQGKGWVGLAWSGGGAWVSLQIGGFQLCSLSFCCSPPAFGERCRTLSLIPGSSDHADPEISEGAANIGVDPVGAVLLALQSRAEMKLSSRKWLLLIKAGTTSPRPRCPSRRNHPERAEQPALFGPLPLCAGQLTPRHTLAPMLF